MKNKKIDLNEDVVFFTDETPTGRVVKMGELHNFIRDDGYVYKIGKQIGNLTDLAQKVLEIHEKETE